MLDSEDKTILLEIHSAVCGGKKPSNKLIDLAANVANIRYSNREWDDLNRAIGALIDWLVRNGYEGKLNQRAGGTMR